MNWLNAALAFSITMLIMSMVVTVFVETIHRIVRLREKGLRLMLGHYFDRELSAHLTRAGYVPESMRQIFLNLMTVNRAPSGAAGMNRDFTSNHPDQDNRLMAWLWSGRRLARLDSKEFMSRLGASEFGDVLRRNISNTGGVLADEVLKDVAQKFDAFGQEAGVYFQARARLLSIVVAIFVAWGMYVHPYELFANYIRNPEITKKVIDMQTAVEEKYQRQQMAIETEREELREAEATRQKAEEDLQSMRQKSGKTVAESGKTQAETVDAVPKNVSEELKDAENKVRSSEEKLRLAMAEAEATIKPLQEIGVPIGWNEHRLAAAGFRAQIFADYFPLPLPMPTKWNAVSVATMCWLILGGLLVGLGGPVWFDIVKSLSSIRSVAGSTKTPSANLDEKASEGANATSQPVTAVEHFKTAAAGRDATQGGSPVTFDDDPTVG
jgi:hypothetical protein